MQRMRSTLACLAVMILLGAGSAEAGASRRGRTDILIGLGSLASQEVTDYGSITLDADDGTALSFMFRHHFSSNVAFEIDLITESDTMRHKYQGTTYETVDADTFWWYANLLIHVMETPVAPYVVAGVGHFSHEADYPGGDIDESGGALQVGVGVDGHFSRNLVWDFDVRMLSYEFEEFQEDWNRLLFSGRLGFRF